MLVQVDCWTPRVHVVCTPCNAAVWKKSYKYERVTCNFSSPREGCEVSRSTQDVCMSLIKKSVKFHSEIARNGQNINKRHRFPHVIFSLWLLCVCRLIQKAVFLCVQVIRRWDYWELSSWLECYCWSSLLSLWPWLVSGGAVQNDWRLLSSPLNVFFFNSSC